MKTISIFKYVAILFIALSFSSCVEDNDFTIPNTGEDKNYANLKSLSEIAALYSNRIVDINEDITTSGYVISDDRERNFYKTVIIQDKPENPTIGFEIKINETNLGADYGVGRKIYINLKNLSIGKDFRTQSFQIGVRGGSRMYSISETNYKKHIERSSEIAKIIPTVLKTDELTNAHVNTLVKLNDLQSDTMGSTYTDPNSTRDANRYFLSCNTFEKIILRTSGFSNFKAFPIPDKKGSITAILNKYNSSFQLKIRDTKDVNLTQDYGCFNNPTAATLAEIKALYNGGDTRILQGSKIKVTITSNLAKGNISNRNAFVQEGTTGIALRFSDTYNLNLGDEIEIAVGGLILSKYNGLLQLNLATSDIINTTAGTLPTPEVITFAQALTGDYESRLVKIEGVQFKDITKKYLGANTLTSDCTNELKVVSVSSNASFKDNQVSTKKGTITGVMSNSNGAQIYIRDEADVNFTEAYACTSTGGGGSGSGSGTDLFITEYAEGSSNNKYIEIYNPTSNEIDLADYAFPNVSNAPSTPGEYEFWNTFTTGAKIPAGGFYIIAHPSANATILAKANQTHRFLSNGDDGFALVRGGTFNDADGDNRIDAGEMTGFTILDWLGDWNADPGSGWTVAGVTNATKDHTLVRKSSITKGNDDWTASAGTNTTDSEWEVKARDDFSSLGVR